jgi:hypothetical protein
VIEELAGDWRRLDERIESLSSKIGRSLADLRRVLSMSRLVQNDASILVRVR